MPALSYFAEFITIAEACFCKGEIRRVLSLRFLLYSARFTSIKLILCVFFLSSTNLLFAAVFRLHLKKNFTSEFGKIFVDAYLPSRTQPLFFFINSF